MRLGSQASKRPAVQRRRLGGGRWCNVPRVRGFLLVENGPGGGRTPALNGAPPALVGDGFFSQAFRGRWGDGQKRLQVVILTRMHGTAKVKERLAWTLGDPCVEKPSHYREGRHSYASCIPSLPTSASSWDLMPLVMHGRL